ncbi:vesicle coat component [Metarhizium acridum]|uniref:vesicle coat component n=1 Tax=Metarhizium acridum TaxID=92637 RepID=UPI001C6B906D|nr:vesicle coat component [Metarhizium acridum]
MAAEPAGPWHPAMRPNSAADVVVPSDKSEAASSIDSNTARQPTQSEEHDATESWFDNEHENEDEANAWLIPEDTEPSKLIDPAQSTRPLQPTEAAEVLGLAETHTHEEQQKSEDAAIAWLTNGDDGDGGAKLLSDQREHSPSGKKPKHSSQEDHADGALACEALNKEHARPDVNEAKETKHVAKGPSSTMAQHSSSMSFARTVSHEITFGDDDDGEWILGRSDTDTFGFMPPSDRTNSFPVVPPISSVSEPNHALPLPSNQALDVMEENEREAELEKDEYMMQSPEGDSSASWHRHVATRRNHAPSRSIGGEIADVTTTAAASRFEEGIPLIPRREAEGEASEAKSDLFADEEANEDDFFSQVQKNDWDSNTKPLERKSTMHVMAAMDDAGTFTRQSTVEEETIEEHADESAEGVALGISETAEPASAIDDLASKWEEAFGGNDNDDFLLDDPTVENTDIDAAAFLGSDDEGLLDDVLDETAPALQTSQPQKPATNPYASINSAAHQSTPYNATAAAAVSAQYPSVIPYSGTPVHYGQTPALPQPEATKAQSFADKSKAGYASPYDLPTDLVTKTVKPRKRPSLQHIPPERAPPPPRSASMYSPGPATPAASALPASSAPPALAGQPPLGLGPETTEKTPAPALRPKAASSRNCHYHPSPDRLQDRVNEHLRQVSTHRDRRNMDLRQHHELSLLWPRQQTSRQPPNTRPGRPRQHLVWPA